jgi:hypothetical protein
MFDYRNKISSGQNLVIRSIGLALLFCFVCSSLSLLAEGTKQLRPYYEANAHLVVMRTQAATDENNTNFASYFSGNPVNPLFIPSENNALRFRIGALTERIYLGFGRYIAEQNTTIGDAVNNQANIDRHNTTVAYTSPNLFYETNNKQLRYRIRRPDGTILVPETRVPLPGEVGYIGDGGLAAYNRAVAGPAQLVGATGYNAILLNNPDQVGDYYIEFVIFNTSTNLYETRKTSLQLFDLTITSGLGVNTVTAFDAAGLVTSIATGGLGTGTGVEIPGRLWSKAWRLSTGNNYIDEFGATIGFNGAAGSGVTNNIFVAKMYPYSDDNIVTEIDFNGMDPFGFTVSCNLNGIGMSGDFILDKRSIYTIPPSPAPQNPLYRIFLQNPDILQFPEGDVGCLQGVSVKQCALDAMMNPVPYCINITAVAVGTVDVLIDIDPAGTTMMAGGDGVYTPNSRDVLISQQILTPGSSTTCVAWDGLDGLGNIIPNGEIMSIKVNFRAGLTNLPIIDVENQRNGIIVSLVRPINNECGAPIRKPKMYWDDTDVQLNVGGVSPDNAFYPAPPSAQATGVINLAGCDPLLLLPGEGCHKWGNRGKNFGSSTVPVGYNRTQEMMNTWWFVADDQLTTPYQNDLSLFDITATLGGGNCVFNDGGDIFIDIQFSRTKFDFNSLNFFIILPMLATFELDFVNISNNDVFPGNLEKRTIRLRYLLDIDADNDYSDPPQTGLEFRFRVETNQCGSPQEGEQNFSCNIILPITLISFSGRIIDNYNARLEWETATEENNKGFVIERSIDGYDFVPVGFVAGNGTINRRQQYSYIDKLAQRGKYYYQLRQIDFDGKESLSKIINLSFDDLEMDFIHAAYNQENKTLQVVVRQKENENIQITIYNMLGVEVQCVKTLARQGQLIQTYHLPINVTTTGTYIVEVKDSKNIAKKKIVVY